MSIFNSLKKLGLASEETSILFHKGVRDDPKLNVYKDISSGVIFIKDYDSGEDVNKTLNYRKENINKVSDDLSIKQQNDKDLSDENFDNITAKDYEKVTDCIRRINDLKPFYIGKDIVDFGCGHGDFLYLSKTNTKSSSGVELNKSFIKKLNNNRIRCEESISAFNNKSIDTVFLFHSFEHLPDPLQSLKEIKIKLRTRGKLIIEVPHANDFLMSALKEESYINFTLWSKHLILHTENSLRRFLEYSGFKNIIIKGIQRYPLSNHLNWISQKQPGGHKSNIASIDTKELSEAYANALSRLGANDTLLAVANNI